MIATGNSADLSLIGRTHPTDRGTILGADS